MINKVSTMEKTNPPIIATPIGIRLVAAVPKASAIGNVPKLVAKLVMRIGRKRDALALMMASSLLCPLANF